MGTHPLIPLHPLTHHTPLHPLTPLTPLTPPLPGEADHLKPRLHTPPNLPLPPQVPTAAVGTDAFQECMAVDLTRPCTKWSYQVQSVEEVRPAMHL